MKVRLFRASEKLALVTRDAKERDYAADTSKDTLKISILTIIMIYSHSLRYEKLAYIFGNIEGLED